MLIRFFGTSREKLETGFEVLPFAIAGLAFIPYALMTGCFPALIPSLGGGLLAWLLLPAPHLRVCCRKPRDFTPDKMA
jgi:hypothetical protein